MKKVIKKKVAKIEQVQELIDVSSIPGLKAIPIITRKFIQYDFDFMSTNNIQLPIINEDDVKDAIVKVNIRIRQTDLHKLDLKGFELSLREHCYYLKPIVPVIHKEHRTRTNTMVNDQTPIEAVKSWLINKNVKDPDKILEAAEKIIRGDTIDT